MATTPLPLSQIVDVQTAIQASAPGFEAFGVTMIIDDENVLNTLPGTTPIVPQIRTYSDLAGMVADGFRPYNQAYRVAQAVFAQVSRPATLKVCGYNNALDLQDFLTAVEAADPAWYWLDNSAAVNDQNPGVATSVMDAAEWCLSIAAGKHCLVFDSNRELEKSAYANIFSQLKDANNSRSSGWWHGGVNGLYSLTFSGDLNDGNTVNITLDSETAAVPWVTSNNASLTAVAAAIEAFDCIESAWVLDTGTAYNRVIVAVAAAQNQRVTSTNFSVTAESPATTAPTASWGLAGQTIALLAFSADFTTGNSFTYAINNGTPETVLFDTDEATTMAAIAASIAAQSGIGLAVVSGTLTRTIAVVTLAESARLDFTTATVSGAAVPSVTTPATVPDFMLSAAVLGECGSAEPGTKAFSNRALQLVSADYLSVSETANILGQNANFYAHYSQNKVATRIGTTASGLTLKNRVTIDAIDLRLQNAIFNAFQENPVVPYSDPGIQLAVNAMRGVFQQAQNAGAILPGWTCAGPARASVSPSDVTAGILKNLTYTYTTSGEIQQAIVRGVAIV